MANHIKFVVVAAAALLCQSYLAIAKPGTANFFQGISVLPPCSDTEAWRGVEIGRGGEIVYAAKASDSLWDGGAACGKTYCVTCTGATDPRKPSPCGGKGSIYATVQGLCSDCKATISISNLGFAQIVTHPDVDSIINVEYTEVDSTQHPCA